MNRPAFFVALLGVAFLILSSVGLASDMRSIPPPLDATCQFVEAEVRKEQPLLSVDVPPPGDGHKSSGEQEMLAPFEWDQLSPRVGFGLTGSRDAETWARRLGAGWYLALGELGKAREHLNLALHHFNECGNTVYLPYVYDTLADTARYFFLNGDGARSAAIVKYALQSADTIKEGRDKASKLETELNEKFGAPIWKQINAAAVTRADILKLVKQTNQ